LYDTPAMSGPTHHGFFKNPINASSVFSERGLPAKKTAPGVARQRPQWCDDANGRPGRFDYGRQKVRKRLWRETRRQSGGTVVESSNYALLVGTVAATTPRQMKIL
jgi:hypothetical protein